jgi:hypothetical protein
MNHEVFQYRDEWYYFKEDIRSECISGCDFPKSPGCVLVKREAGLPLCEGRTIKKLKPDIFAFGDTIVVVGTGREYRVVQSSIVGNHCDSCEFRAACRYGAEKYCPVFCTLQRIDTIQSQPHPAKHSIVPIMPKVIRLSTRNYIDENNNIYDLLQSSNKPSNQLTRCRIEDGVNSYSCIIDIDKIEKHHLIEHPTSISCSACILSNLTTKPCHDVIGACMQYDKAWIINPQCMDSLIEQQILRIANIGYIKGTDPIINSKSSLTPKESFPVEKHITIKRSNFKPKITKLKEVKWKTQTTKNR